ncbi:MAG: hypothetical protein FD167_519 [bacterium]|nr:MAG: hypothetical protein FD167_519 [bacterium]
MLSQRIATFAMEYSMLYHRYHQIVYTRFIVLLILLLVFNPIVIAQVEKNLSQRQDNTDKTAYLLEQDKKIERELAGGDVHSYKINLTVGQFLHIAIEQHGIDIVALLFAPDNKQLIEINRLNEKQGREALFLIAETTGSYQLDVRSIDENAAPAHYEITIAEQRQFTLQDKDCIAAQEAYLAAYRLKNNQTAASRTKAIDSYLQALRLWRSIDRHYEALTLTAISHTQFLLGDNKKVLEYLDQALPLWQAIGDKYFEALTLNNIGLIYNLLGKNQKALEYFNQALPMRQTIGDRAGEATTLNNIGILYKSIAENQKALDYFNQALQIHQSLGSKTSEAATLSNIGVVYRLLIENQKALTYYSRALELQKSINDKVGEAATLSNIGVIYIALGENQKALLYCNQALELQQTIGNKIGQANTFNSIGAIYKSLAENQKALDYYNQALALRQAIGDKAGEANTLSNIGVIYITLGENQKALLYCNQALPLQQAIGDKIGEGYCLNNIGGIYKSQGENQKALDYYTQSLKLRQAIGDKVGEASSLNNIGVVYNSQGEYQKALEFYSQALILRRAASDKIGEATTLLNMAKTNRHIGELNKALIESEKSISLIESLRTKIDIKALRATYFASVQDHYEFYIDLLMQLHQQYPLNGYAAVAFENSERASARNLLELLAESKIDLYEGIAPTLLEQEHRLKQLLNAKAELYQRLLGNRSMAQQVESLRKEIEKLIEQLQQIEAEIRQQSPRYAALTQPQPLSLRQIQKEILDDDTLLLKYSLGSERSFLWAITPTFIKSYELPKRTEIEVMAQRVYELLTAYRQIDFETSKERAKRLKKAEHQYPAATTALSKMLLSPVASLLGKKRLIIVGDEILQYIPFATLPKPKKHLPSTPYSALITEHEIVSLPSVSTLALLRREFNGRKSALKSVVIFADPVFEKNDQRIITVSTNKQQMNGIVENESNSSLSLLALERSAEESGLKIRQGFVRLPATRKEAEAIMALMPTNQVKEALDFAASRAMATSLDISQYSVVHFATHALLNNSYPELSGIVLSLVDQNGMEQDGFLRLHDVFNLKLHAELVILSGCQTGLGKQIKGEGLVGLSRGFMYAGASRVLVSLWNVSDQATAELMKRFYRHMFGKDKLRPAAALRVAQLSMLREKRWQSPFYWAAFVLQGEPR